MANGRPGWPGRSLIVLGALASGLGCQRVEVVPGPNLVLISIDTLRPDRLGAYGNPRDTSPTIDRLAEEGVLFASAADAMVQRPVFSQMPSSGVSALRDGRWKIIEHARGDESGRWAFYDLENDPGESRDLSKNRGGEQHAAFDALRGQLRGIHEHAEQARRAVIGGRSVELDASTREALERLGYLSGSN